MSKRTPIPPSPATPPGVAPPSLARFLPAAVAALAAAAAACSSSSGDDSFQVRIAPHKVLAGSALTVGGRWAVYYAEETTATGSEDLNGDLDTDDTVAVVLDLAGARAVPLGIVALEAVIVANEVYLAVSETDDGTDWNLDADMDDTVLVHWSLAADAVTFVDTLDPAAAAPPLVSVAGRLIYASADVPAGDASSLRRIEPAMPLVPEVVENVPGFGVSLPRILGEEAGLVLLALDEAVSGELNADGDADDAVVLALLDGTSEQGVVVSAGLALADADAPVRARRTNAGDDWLVAALVSEDFQDDGSLNDAGLFDPAWQPAACVSVDSDETDDVLFYLYFEALAAGMPGSDPRNTGLVGRERVLVVEDFVATLSDESAADCDLNGDMDTADRVLRWTEAVADGVDVLPPGAMGQLRAVLASVPGGSLGVSALSSRFVAVVNETEDGVDIDGTAADFDLVGWLDPAQGTAAEWTFDHDPSATNTEFAGAGWMADEVQSGRLGVAFQEAVTGLSLNSACSSLTFADADTQDELPTFVRFASSGQELLFPGVGVALDPGNGGLVQAGGSVLFRSSEMQQEDDLNGDGDTDDLVLVRNSLFTCQPVVMGTSSAVAGPAVETDGVTGGVYLASETMANRDLNDDGVVGDLVVAYFTF